MFGWLTRIFRGRAKDDGGYATPPADPAGDVRPWSRRAVRTLRNGKAAVWKGLPAEHPGRFGCDQTATGGFVHGYVGPSRYEAMTSALEAMRGVRISARTGEQILTGGAYRFPRVAVSVGDAARYSYFRREVMPWIVELIGKDGAELVLRGLHATASEGAVVDAEWFNAAAALNARRESQEPEWRVVHAGGEVFLASGDVWLSRHDAMARAATRRPTDEAGGE